MHDPMIQIYGCRLFNLWHVDPEIGGSDDSCGYSYVRLSKADQDWAEKTSTAEWKFWFGGTYGKYALAESDDLAVMAAVWKEARNRATGKHRSEPLSPWDVGQVFNWLTCPMDNFHVAISEAKAGPDGLFELLTRTLRVYRTRTRKWYQHPRWHIRHWRFQVHPVQRFKRWAWTRCGRCGGRFEKGQLVYGGWDSEGPQWFRSERGVYHGDCQAAIANKVPPVGADA